MTPRRPLLPLLVLVLAAAAAAQRAPGAARDWEHEGSDIPVNPRITFGELDNGLRWAWMSNAEPRERLYLRLHVDVGSLAEEDHEQGLAHFLEHMAFNGSEHFEPGTLVEWFQGHGMDFGADSNASTDFSETIYELDLPHADEATLRDGLTFLRDVAGGLDLSAEEVAAEIGVIDGEQRERDSAAFRAAIADLQDAFEGTRVAVRIPIGVQEVRAAFTADVVRAFWRRWYRPENLTLVVVGDLGALDPAPAIRDLFGDLPVPEAPPAEEPARGTPPQRDDAFAFFHPELPVVTLAAARTRPWEDEPFTRAEVVEDLPLDYARRMVNLRLRELARKEDAPFLQAGLSPSGGLRVAEGTELSVVARPERWQEALAVGEQELRRALQHGFRPQELDEVRKEALRALDEAVEREATRPSASWVREILGAAEERLVPTTAATDRELLRPAIEALTPEACRDALRAEWGRGHLRLSAVGGLDLGADGPARLLAAWEDSGRVEVAPPPELADRAFAYASRAEDAGEVAARSVAEDLGLTQVAFANGVRLNVKATDFRERQVLVLARVGQGLLTLPPERFPVAWMAGQAFDQFALGQHDPDELRRLTAGRQVGATFSVGENAFVLRGSTTPDDLLLQLDLMRATLVDPGWREEALAEVRRGLPPIFEQLAHDPSGPLQLSFLRRLHSGDPRFALPPREALEAVTLDEIRAWLAPLLAGSPIELTVVGDVDVEAVVAAAARTFGALPPRAQPADHAERLQVALASGLHDEATIETELDKSLLFLVQPLTDGRDAAVRRRLNLLGRVVDDRLRVLVREREGLAYSPGAAVNASDVYPGVGYLLMNVFADPARVADARKACLSIADSLATDGVTAEELERMRTPLLAQLRDQMRNNGFWLGVLQDCQARPAALDEIRRVESDYLAITAETLGALAKQYLGSARASWLVVTPAAVASTDAPAEGAAPQGG